MHLKSVRRMQGLCFSGWWRWTHHFLLVIWLLLLVDTLPNVDGYFLGETKAVLKGCEDHWTLQDRAAMPLLLQMTLCVDIRVVIPGAWVAFSYSSAHAPRPELGLEGDDEALYGWLLKVRHRFPIRLAPTHWHRVCLRRDVPHNSFSLEVNGEIVAERRVIAQAIPPQGSLWLGCRPTDKQPGATLGEVELYMFRMWADVGDHGLCEDGTVIGWNARFWGVTSPRASQRDPDLMCDHRRLRRKANSQSDEDKIMTTDKTPGRGLSSSPGSQPEECEISQFCSSCASFLIYQHYKGGNQHYKGGNFYLRFNAFYCNDTVDGETYSCHIDIQKVHENGKARSVKSCDVRLTFSSTASMCKPQYVVHQGNTSMKVTVKCCHTTADQCRTFKLTSVDLDRTPPKCKVVRRHVVPFHASCNLEHRTDNKNTKQSSDPTNSNITTTPEASTSSVTTITEQTNMTTAVTPSTNHTAEYNETAVTPSTNHTAEYNDTAFTPSTNHTTEYNETAFTPSTNHTTEYNETAFTPSTNHTAEYNETAVTPSTNHTTEYNETAFTPSTNHTAEYNETAVTPSTNHTAEYNETTFTPSTNHTTEYNETAFIPSTNHTAEYNETAVTPSTNHTAEYNETAVTPSTNHTAEYNDTSVTPSTNHTTEYNETAVTPSTNHTVEYNEMAFTPSTNHTTEYNETAVTPSTNHTAEYNETAVTPSTNHTTKYNDTAVTLSTNHTAEYNDTAVTPSTNHTTEYNETAVTPSTNHTTEYNETAVTPSTNHTAEYNETAFTPSTNHTTEYNETAFTPSTNHTAEYNETAVTPSTNHTAEYNETAVTPSTNHTAEYNDTSVTPSTNHTTEYNETAVTPSTNHTVEYNEMAFTPSTNHTTEYNETAVTPSTNHTAEYNETAVTPSTNHTTKYNDTAVTLSTNHTAEYNDTAVTPSTNHTTEYNETAVTPSTNHTTEYNETAVTPLTASSFSTHLTTRVPGVNTTTTAANTSLEASTPTIANTTTPLVSLTASTESLQTTTLTNRSATKPGTGTSSTTTSEMTTKQEAQEEQANQLLYQTKDVSQLNSSQVAKVVGDLEKLLDGPTVSQAMGQKAVNVISNLMEGDSQALSASANRLIHLVEDLGLKLVVTGDKELLSSGSLVLAVKEVDGTSFPVTYVDIFNTNNIQIHALSRSRVKRSGSALGSVIMPASFNMGLSLDQQKQANRVQFSYYAKSDLFQDAALGNQTLVSPVLAVSVANLSISNLTENIEFTIRNVKLIHKNYTASCAFWDFTQNGAGGGWRSAGCFLVNATPEETTCSCNHLTSFAILMDISREGMIDRQQAQILTFITYVGCGISAIFLALTLLTYISFEKLLRDIPAKILVQLCLSLLLLNLVFLLDGWLALHPATGLCISTAFFLHYFLLTSFTWAGLEALHMYLSIVRVFTPYLSRYMLKFSLIGWGIPLLVVIVIISVDKDNYGLVTYGKYTDGTSDDFCWLRNNIAFYVGVVAYFLLIFALCLLVFIVVMIQLSRIKKQNPQNQPPNRGLMTDLRSITGLIILLGFTWGFALFAWGPLYFPFVYLFTIFNSLQGFLVFIFHCAVKESVRRQWRTNLCCGKLRLAENSDWSSMATQGNRNRPRSVVKATTSAQTASRRSSVISDGTNSSEATVLNEIHRRTPSSKGQA